MWSSNTHLLRHLCSLVLVGDAFKPFNVLSGGLKKRAREEETKTDGSQAGKDVEDGDNKRQDQESSVWLVFPAVFLMDSWLLWFFQQTATQAFYFPKRHTCQAPQSLVFQLCCAYTQGSPLSLEIEMDFRERAGQTVPIRDRAWQDERTDQQPVDTRLVPSVPQSFYITMLFPPQTTLVLSFCSFDLSPKYPYKSCTILKCFCSASHNVCPSL